MIKNFFYLVITSLSFIGNAQNFEVSPNVVDSIAPTDYLIHVSGYATFNDSMTFHVDMTDTLGTSVLNLSKDMGDSTDVLVAGFVFDPIQESFSFDVGNYTSRFFKIRIWTEIEGVLTEEVLIDTY
jgi:hypothetical protein